MSLTKFQIRGREWFYRIGSSIGLSFSLPSLEFNQQLLQSGTGETFSPAITSSFFFFFLRRRRQRRRHRLRTGPEKKIPVSVSFLVFLRCSVLLGCLFGAKSFRSRLDCFSLFPRPSSALALYFWIRHGNKNQKN